MGELQPEGATEPTQEVDESASRRDFIAKVGSAVFGGVVLAGIGLAQRGATDVLATGVASATDGPAPPFHIATQASEDVLIKMQRELSRALAKTMDQRRWGMVIDTRKCIGCSACTVGCVMENKLPPGVVYRPVLQTEVGTYPDVTRKFIPRPCMHCDNPPCVPVCPVGATGKRSDGIVYIDYDRCIGCRYCITACPYQARTFDFGGKWTDGAAGGSDGALALESGREYQDPPNFEYGESWTRPRDGVLAGTAPHSPIGNARKCHFCAHRLAEGMLPMCVSTCVGRATFFGDLNDPESLVSELAAGANATRLKEDMGTEPKVYYLA